MGKEGDKEGEGSFLKLHKKKGLTMIKMIKT